MKTVAIYFHGLGGTSDSSKGKSLKDYLSQYGIDVIIPDLSPDPSIVKSEIDSLIRSLFDGDNRAEKLVLVGISLGGFYARYFGERFDAPYVIVNPVIHPTKILRQFIGCKVLHADDMLEIDEDFVSKFDALETTEMSGSLANVMLSLDDQTIPYQESNIFFKHAKNLVLHPNGGHDFTDNWKVFQTFVLSAINQ